MQQYESEHYIFHYSEGTYIEKNIENIAEEQEKCFRYICSVLQMKPDYKIQYFLFESSREIAKVSNEKFGTDYESLNGFAYLEEIYAVYNENEKCIGFHEDAHLISFVDGYGDSVAVREGLAMFFDREWWGIHNLHWVNYYVKNGFSVSIDQMIRNDEYFYSVSDIISYPIMGAFTEWLIGLYGIGKYKLFFKDENVSLACEKIFDHSLEQMNQLFLEYISLFSVDEAVEKRMETLLKEHGIN